MGIILNILRFYEEICYRIEDQKRIIEDNRDNNKKTYYKDHREKISKSEPDCRDIFLQQFRAGNVDLDFTKELYEGENRVDINARLAMRLDFEVQIECKKDNNSQLYSGIDKQLINKYLSSNVEYGIYLVFYFGNKKDKQAMIAKLNRAIPGKYKNNIRIVCIDLTL